MTGDRDRTLRARKLDALYIYHHPVLCALIYFAFCFTWLRVLYDILKEPTGSGISYAAAFVFAAVFGWVMNRWAVRQVKRYGLENIL